MLCLLQSTVQLATKTVVLCQLLGYNVHSTALPSKNCHKYLPSCYKLLFRQLGHENRTVWIAFSLFVAGFGYLSYTQPDYCVLRSITFSRGSRELHISAVQIIRQAHEEPG